MNLREVGGRSSGVDTLHERQVDAVARLSRRPHADAGPRPPRLRPRLAARRARPARPSPALTWTGAGARRAAARRHTRCTRRARPSPPAGVWVGLRRLCVSVHAAPQAGSTGRGRPSPPEGAKQETCGSAAEQARELPQPMAGQAGGARGSLAALSLPQPPPPAARRARSRGRRLHAHLDGGAELGLGHPQLELGLALLLDLGQVGGQEVLEVVGDLPNEGRRKRGGTGA